MLIHGTDLVAFTVLIYLTEGRKSPLFIYFFFALLATTLRWQWQGTLWTALVILPILAGMGVYAAREFDEATFELNRYIIRSVYLGVMAIMLGYLSAYKQILRYELSQLAAWPRDIPKPSFTDGLGEAQEPWRYIIRASGAPSGKRPLLLIR